MDAADNSLNQEWFEPIDQTIVYQNRVPRGLASQTCVVFRGLHVRSNGDRFHIIFACEAREDESPANIALNIDIRYEEGAVVRNACINGRWLRPEDFGCFPLVPGERFIINVSVQDSVFKIIINGVASSEYSYRVPPESIRIIAVRGQAALISNVSILSAYDQIPTLFTRVPQPQPQQQTSFSTPGYPVYASNTTYNSPGNACLTPSYVHVQNSQQRICLTPNQPPSNASMGPWPVVMYSVPTANFSFNGGSLTGFPQQSQHCLPCPAGPAAPAPSFHSPHHRTPEVSQSQLRYSMYRPSRTNRQGQADSQRTEAPNGSFHHLPQPYVERAQGTWAAGQNPVSNTQQPSAGHGSAERYPSYPPLLDFAGYMDSAPDFNDGNRTPEHLQGHKAREDPHMGHMGYGASMPPSSIFQSELSTTPSQQQAADAVVHQQPSNRQPISSTLQAATGAGMKEPDDPRTQSFLLKYTETNQQAGSGSDIQSSRPEMGSTPSTPSFVRYFIGPSDTPNISSPAAQSSQTATVDELKAILANLKMDISASSSHQATEQIRDDNGGTRKADEGSEEHAGVTGSDSSHPGTLGKTQNTQSKSLDEIFAADAEATIAKRYIGTDKANDSSDNSSTRNSDSGGDLSIDRHVSGTQGVQQEQLEIRTVAGENHVDSGAQDEKDDSDHAQ